MLESNMGLGGLALFLLLHSWLNKLIDWLSEWVTRRFTYLFFDRNSVKLKVEICYSMDGMCLCFQRNV